jgi:drug/metabolite transporter (DMT)-like permease
VLIKSDQILLKNLILIGALVLLQVLGNISLSRGMRQIGKAITVTPDKLILLGMQTLSNPWVLLGIGIQIICLVLYMSAISRLDLSYVLPIMSSSYVLTTLFAWIILEEKIAPNRWIGSLLVSIGVMLAGLTSIKQSSFRGSSDDVNL